MSEFPYVPYTDWRWRGGYYRVHYDPYRLFTKDELAELPFIVFIGGSAVIHLGSLEAAASYLRERVAKAVVSAP